MKAGAGGARTTREGGRGTHAAAAKKNGREADSEHESASRPRRGAGRAARRRITPRYERR
ncbi:protein of unknown function [Burkholderia multivorans]